MSKVANKAFDNDSESRAEIQPPAIADKIPPTPTMTAARISTLLADLLRNVPVIAVGIMTANDVPFAMTLGKPSNTIIAGIMMTPPPTPNKPANTPVATPTAINTIQLRRVNWSRPEPEVLQYKRTAEMMILKLQTLHFR